MVIDAQRKFMERMAPTYLAVSVAERAERFPLLSATQLRMVQLLAAKEKVRGKRSSA